MAMNMIPAPVMATEETDFVSGEQVNNEIVEEGMEEEITMDAQVMSTKAEEKVAGVAVDEVNFPDPAFRAYVSERIDTQKDGVLTLDEISKVNYIACHERGITNMKGIEYFTELKN